MNRYVCIHGHFYQPPRENAWLEQVEYQTSAAPYHDWNERITDECYAPNIAARTINNEGRIINIANNFRSISFNVGPTLLSWMRAYAPDVYDAIRQADADSVTVFSGHGNAMAQAYSHLIMPLASRRDKETQVAWGIADFRFHFGREPEGMWLPETAVDLESLDLMAEQGIKFTLLAPHQARRVKDAAGNWHDVTASTLDTTRPYCVHLPSGRSIAVFFYDAAVAHAVAFERLLENGKVFAERLSHAFGPAQGQEQAALAHIATDGETYGHHHRYGEMALAYALHQLRENGQVALTNYGEFLSRFPPVLEAEIHPNTSWSCAHGVERWRSDCGCATGGHHGWNQAWRAGLRRALDDLRDALAVVFEEQGAKLFQDPWAARNDFICVLLDRSPENVTRFLKDHLKTSPEQNVRQKALTLLHMEKFAMLMFTSCAWFFEELTGVETLQVLQYAARAIQLSHQLNGYDLRPRFLELMREVRSNLGPDGREVFEKMVETAMVDLAQVGAHFAITSLFDHNEELAIVGGFRIQRGQVEIHEAGRARLLLGSATVSSTATEEKEDFSFGAVHLGDHNIHCGVEPAVNMRFDPLLVKEIATAFSQGDLAATILLLNKNLGEPHYSLKSLFRDDQRRILQMILHNAQEEAETDMRQVYEANAPLMRFLSDIKVPPPKVFLAAAEVVVNGLLDDALSGKIDPPRLRMLFEEAKVVGVPLDLPRLALSLTRNMNNIALDWMDDPTSLTTLKRLEQAVSLKSDLPLEMDLWEIQNHVYNVLQKHYLPFLDKSHKDDKTAVSWLEHFRALAENLFVLLP